MNMLGAVDRTDSDYIPEGTVIFSDLLGQVASDVLSAPSFSAAQARVSEIRGQISSLISGLITKLNRELLINGPAGSGIYNVQQYTLTAGDFHPSYEYLRFSDAVKKLMELGFTAELDQIVGLAIRGGVLAKIANSDKAALVLYSQAPSRTAASFFIESSVPGDTIILSPIVTINPITIKSEVVSDYVYESGSILSKIFLPPVIYTSKASERVTVESSKMPLVLAAIVAYFALKG